MSEPDRKADGASRPRSRDEGSLLTLIAMLASSATIQLGLVDNPITKRPQKDLKLAKHTIDLLAALEAKTKGNLTDEEKAVLTHVLNDLRLRYVDAAK